MLWLVGNASKDFDAYCEVHGIEYRRFTAIPSKADARTVYIDMSSMDAVHASLAALHPQPAVDALFVAGFEHYVLPEAWIADYFGVAGCTVQSAQNATDKALMRQAFCDYDPSITPEFALVSEWPGIELFMQSRQFPVMLKPANLMKSLFITKNDSLDELRANYAFMTQKLPATYRRYRLGKPRIIIEEYLVGSMHTVAGYVNQHGKPQLIEQIVDCITARDIGIDDSYLFSRRLPSSLSEPQQTAVLDVAAKAVIALGLTSTPVHVELMYTADGAKVIEVGARLGGYRPRMYDLGCGLDLYQLALQTARAEQIVLISDRTRAVSVIEAFPKRDGTFAGATDDNELRHLPSLVDLHWKAAAGDAVGTAQHGHRASAIITLAHDDANQVRQDEQWLQRNFTVPLV